MSLTPSAPHQPRVSLLIPNRDNAAVLDLVLDGLARHTTYPDVEVVVVDDGSTDGSRPMLRRWRDSKEFQGDVRLIEQEHTDGGVVDALNAALGAATGELVVQLDADASIETPRWLEKMVSFFVSDPRIGVVTGRVVIDSGELDACGIELVSVKGYHSRGWEITEPPGLRTALRNVTRFREDEWPGCEQIAEVDAGIGACMMYRREQALEVGGYDRGFAPVWMDDLDLTISLRRAGLKVFYLPDVRALHHLGKRNRPDSRPVPPMSVRATASRLRHSAGAVLPNPVRVGLVHALRWDRGPREYRKFAAAHYGYWRKKWGWNMLNPDMDEIRKRWGATEICWSLNPEMRRAGQEIIAAFNEVRSMERSDIALSEEGHRP